jgi:elongation factor 1 alpha-like protein
MCLLRLGSKTGLDGHRLMGAEEEELCVRPHSFANFFKDTPWLNVPVERQAVLIPPLFVRGGLLGGSSDGAPKMSKLQALAAARKKKTLEQKSGSSTGVEQPMAKLSLDQSNPDNPIRDTTITDPIPVVKSGSRGFPIRKRKDSNPHEKIPKVPHDRELHQTTSENSMESETVDQAEPSAFANTMFGNTSSSLPRRTDNLFSLPYVAAAAAAPLSADPFAGPSPDDVVIAAQSKGSTKSVRP